ncbi:MAG: ABC transporter ATP-binding protein [Legionellales bacterium]|nr:ABC transporter ATP-binding protein [Legionellales bacterium]|tara:strand:- start:4942 stop:5721 length:780 start_codon:yes stop_codon:yes gene_type:complete
MSDAPNVIEIEHLTTGFADTIVHEDCNLTVRKGEILAIVGGSGAGKTTLLRAILALHKQAQGSIKVLDQEVIGASPYTMSRLSHQWGVMFQQGALFTSLTVLENVCFPLREFTHLSKSLQEEIARVKIALARFPVESLQKFPAELSGGMLKRAALARAMVMDPQILFLDEPTAGLDPESASALDELILDLQSALGLTIVIVTHDLDTLWRVTDRVAFLGDRQVLAVEPMETLVKSEQPTIKAYFSNPRAHLADPVHKED